MLDVQLFGLNPRWHHLMNLLFHIVDVLLLFFVLHRMTKAPWKSAFVAALFALHPLHVESVAWAAERKDVLSALFWMLSLIAYSYYAEKRRLRSYLAVIAFFALGLTAKPMLVSLPFVLLLLDYWPLGRFANGKPAVTAPAKAVISAPGRVKKRKAARHTPGVIPEVAKPPHYEFRPALIRPLVLEKIPLLVLAFLSCVATYLAQSRGGAVTALQIIPLGTRLANALVSCLLYIYKTIRPADLAAFYPHPGLLPLWQVFGAALFLVAVTYAVFRTAKSYPFLPVGWLWFTGALVPVIGIVQAGAQAMADRYTYIPSIGLFVMAAWGIPQLFVKPRHKQALAAISALVLLWFFVLTQTQVTYWHDSLALCDHALSVTQDNYYMYNNRGHALENRGDYTRAVEDFTRAIKIDPRYADAYNNRGVAYGYLGDHEKAVRDYDRAIEINPDHANAYFNRGVDRGELGDSVQAVRDFDQAIRIDPQYADAYYFRGVVRAMSGDQDQAVEDWKKAATLGSQQARKILDSQGID